jgi:DNA polymerase (family 10)
VENLAIARILYEIADLLELKDENPFKIRAYRNAAQVIADTTDRVVNAADADLLALPGIGKDLAGRIREICATGSCLIYLELQQEFPPSILELLRLQGVGAKTVALIYRSLNIATLDELEQAATAGALRKLRGMGEKKEQLILKAIAERRQHEGRHLLADTAAVVEPLLDYLKAHAPDATIEAVGSFRRGADTCGDIDVLVCGAGPEIMDVFTRYHLVERILGRGDTKSSVLLWKGYQADLRLVPAESRGAALQYFTGSKAHNIALRQRAVNMGLLLNEYGLFRESQRVAGETEEGIYDALGLAYVDPALRENRGEFAAAEANALPRLIALEDLRGDLHMHTIETDGKDDIETMALAAKAAGLEYIAITDHSQSLAMANGLNEARALAHAARIREIGARIDGITLLAGIECDIRPDGTMDLADECLAQLDLVVASVHSAFNLDQSQMTDRVLRAIDNPYVDILGHPTGRLILRREPYKLDIDAVIKAAAQRGVAIEINSQIDRLDFNDINARLAKQHGVKIVISSDAHSRHGLAVVRWGVRVARRAWLEAGDVLNTRPVADFQRALRRNRTAAQAQAPAPAAPASASAAPASTSASTSASASAPMSPSTPAARKRGATGRRRPS